MSDEKAIDTDAFLKKIKNQDLFTGSFFTATDCCVNCISFVEKTHVLNAFP